MATFANIHARLGQSDSLLDFACIKTSCTTSTGLKIERACAILAKGIRDLTSDLLKELIKCLLCKKDQRAATRLLEHWCKELSIPTPAKKTRKSCTSATDVPSATSSEGSRTRSHRRISSRSASPLAGGLVVSPTPCPAQKRYPDTQSLNEHPDEAHDEAFPMHDAAASVHEYRRKVREASRTPAVAVLQSSTRHGSGSARSRDHSSSHDSFCSRSLDEDSSGSPATFCVEPPLANLGISFSDGDDCALSTEATSRRVLKTLFSPMPRGKSFAERRAGHVYAVAVPGYKQNIVKIGWTTQDVKTRLRGIERPHGVHLALGDYRACWMPSEPALRRLERVVFAELGKYQRKLRIPRNDMKPQEHVEYYAIDLPTAATTIQLWAHRMTQLDMTCGNSVDNQIVDAVHHRHEARLPVFLKEVDSKTASGPDDLTQHQQRQDFWSDVFLDDSGGVRSSLRVPYSFAAASVMLAVIMIRAGHFVSPLGTSLFLGLALLYMIGLVSLHSYWLSPRKRIQNVWSPWHAA